MDASSKIFISWSGMRSFAVAAKLKDWLPFVLPAAEPWISTDDIRKGSRWQAEIGSALEAAAAGILCLTKDGLQSPWLLFEAGAISKAVPAGKPAVCSYLIDVENSEVGLPLGMFQSTIANRDDTLRLVRDLNERLASKVPDDRLEILFGKFWPDLEETVVAAKMKEKTGKASLILRSDREMIEEILDTVRGIARSSNQQFAISGMPRDYGLLSRLASEGSPSWKTAKSYIESYVEGLRPVEVPKPSGSSTIVTTSAHEGGKTGATKSDERSEAAPKPDPPKKSGGD